MKSSTLIGGSVLTSLFSGTSQLVGAPWGAVMAIATTGLLFTLILGLAQLAMPQESHDKVLLWEKFFAYQERRRTVVALQRSATVSERTPARHRGPAGRTTRGRVVDWRARAHGRGRARRRRAT